MKWVCLGLNYKTAPVEVREKFVVPAHKIPHTGKELLALEGLAGCVILSTCNRMEIYFSINKSASPSIVRSHLLENHALEPELARHFYLREGMVVARHLCRVLSGLDSMVLGETEILGQVKKAYALALEAGLTEGHLNKLFQKAFSIGKKVRTRTSINKGATSVGAVAVDLAEEIFGSLDKTKVLILGAGEMSRVTAQSLKSRGASGIFVANRSYGRAVELAKAMDGEAIRYDHWTDHLKNVDIVIASTAAPHYIVRPEELLPLRASRKYRPLFLIDISVPRNIDPAVADIDEVYLYDIDTLSALAESGREKRMQAIQDCESIIEQEMSEIQKKDKIPHLVLGSRGSALAMAQAEIAAGLLQQRYKGMAPSIKVIKTTGDIRTDVPLSQVARASGIVDKGVFIKELETALLEGKIDAAVHSLKDMPSELDERFKIAAVLPRDSALDIIVSKRGTGEAALPPNAVVATSSIRRKRQLLHLRPDLQIVDIRGNVPTRLEKLCDMEDWDAILLSEAGLYRLGLTREILADNSTPLYVTCCDPANFLPAAGQGVIAIEVCADNTRVAALLAPLNDPSTAISVRAEREFLRLLGAGCSTPVGVYTVLSGDQLKITARVFDEQDAAAAPIEVSAEGDASSPEEVALAAYRQITE